jgi:hypothetical protein
MKTNIAKVMKKADASLSLIASNLVAGKYQTRAELKRVKASVDNAISLSSKAFVALLKPVKAGRKGLAKIANDEFDQDITDVAQAQIKAQILGKVIDAELDDLGEEPTDEIVDNEDFGVSDEDLSEAPADVDDGNGSATEQVAPILKDVVVPVVENLVPPVADDLVEPAVEKIVVPAVEKVVDEITDEVKDDEGETADLDVEEDLDLGTEDDGLDDIDSDDLSQGEDTLDEFFEDEAVEPIDTGVAKAKAAKRAAVKAARKKMVINKGSQMSLLESVFDFK